MKFRFPKLPLWGRLVFLVGMIVIGFMTSNRWLPTAKICVNQTIAYFRNVEKSDDHHDDKNDHASHGDHSGHDHGHGGHADHKEDASLELSKQALKNLGLTSDQIRPIVLETFHQSLTIPAVIVERPGRTQLQVATPMTGVITHVHSLEGEAVKPGTLLFQIRLTHEDLVNAQTNFLKTLGELDVEQHEIVRLTEVTRSGAVAGKVLLEREYARDKLNALLKAQKESLRLHGLSDGQVQQIVKTRRLLRELQIFAPSIDRHSHEEMKLTKLPTVEPISLIKPIPSSGDHHHDEHDAHQHSKNDQKETLLILQKLNVHKGQSVKAGETLCVLTDYKELYVEGLAFEQDVAVLRETSKKNWKVSAVLSKGNSSHDIVKDLEIAYLSNQVDPKSRTLKFYVRLPNKIVNEKTVEDAHYVEWKYLPGQRLQLKVPVKEWTNQIVLPIEAIAQEGAEYYVFVDHGGHFDRVSVHVKYRDQHSVVIASGDTLHRGDKVARRGAHQMQMTLKNKSGGGIDPHAGHSH